MSGKKKRRRHMKTLGRRPCENGSRDLNDASIGQRNTKDCWHSCHFLLQCVKEKSESKVAQWCPTLFDPMDCSPPDPSAHGIFQARVLEWGAIAFSDYKVTISQLKKRKTDHVYKGLMSFS